MRDFDWPKLNIEPVEKWDSQIRPSFESEESRIHSNKQAIKDFEDGLILKIIPVDFRGGWETFDTTQPEHAKMLIEAKAWVETFGKRTPAGLRLAGAVGCGKTRTAYAIIEALIRHGVYHIKATNSVEFFQEIRATYDTPGESEREVIEYFINCRVLLIDDIGVETGRNIDKFQFVLERFFLILDRAQRTHRPTIITTSNLYLSELRKLWGAGMGERVVDRLEQLTEDLGVFPNESMRKSQKQRNRGETNAEKSTLAPLDTSLASISRKKRVE